MRALTAPPELGTTPVPARTEADLRGPRSVDGRSDIGDRIFHTSAGMTGLIVMGFMAAVGLFLTIKAFDALRVAKFDFITTADWQPDRAEFGIASVLIFTLSIAFVAVAAALPMALGTALFITEVAPIWLRSTLVALVDLMAAVPSVVYGLWGVYFLQPHALGLARWINTWLGWIPIFEVSGADPDNPLATASVYTSSTFIAGIVVAMMVMPIQCSMMREVFSQVPIGEREGAFALGSTRWGMIRVVSLPFGKGGIIGGTMLGLGRALGETIAVYLIISPRFDISFHPLEAGSNSVSALIALRAPESSGFGLSALMAAGLALFALTLAVNFIASGLIAKSRSGASSEA